MRKILFFILFLSAVFNVRAQQVKKPIDHSVYDGWQSVANSRISNDGKWISYVIRPQAGDATLIFTDVKNAAPFKVKRADTIRFTGDSKYAVFLIRPFYQETRQAKIKKKKPEDMPKDTLGYITLGTRIFAKVPAVRSFKMADQAPVIAYLSPSDTVKKPLLNDTSKKAVGATVAPPIRDGVNLTVLQLTNGKQRTFKFVTEYQLSENGKLLAFAVTAPRKLKDKETKSGLYLYDIGKNELKDISNGRGTYKNLAFDDTGRQLAFTAEKNPEKAQVKPFKLYYYTAGADSAKIIAAPGSDGMPSKWAVSGDGRVYFSKSGANLFFGTAPIPKPVDTTIVDFEVARVDIWNYKDDYLQPQQLKNLQRELRRNYLAVIHPEESSKLLQLGNPGIQDIAVAANTDARYV